MQRPERHIGTHRSQFLAVNRIIGRDRDRTVVAGVPQSGDEAEIGGQVPDGDDDPAGVVQRELCRQVGVGRVPGDDRQARPGAFDAPRIEVDTERVIAAIGEILQDLTTQPTHADDEVLRPLG